MTIGKRIIVITIISLVLGLIGGFIGSHFFPAPFYFGFFFGFTLSGLVGMFMLAAHIEENGPKKP